VKHLLLLRHGKSDSDARPDADHERPLTRRGRKAAELMGTYLSRIEREPDLVLTSSAVRARATAELAGEAGCWTCPRTVLPELYGAAVADVLRCVSAQDDRMTRLLIVGHEPTLSELIGGLVGGGSIRVPTAALASIVFEVNRWRDVTLGLGELQWLVVPRALAAFAGG
jgi:phosphohistidine phosphatase